eukprot:3648622-Prymnesium_polylepis.1
MRREPLLVEPPIPVPVDERARRRVGRARRGPVEHGVGAKRRQRDGRAHQPARQQSRPPRVRSRGSGGGGGGGGGGRSGGGGGGGTIEDAFHRAEVEVPVGVEQEAALELCGFGRVRLARRPRQLSARQRRREDPRMACGGTPRPVAERRPELGAVVKAPRRREGTELRGQHRVIPDVLLPKHVERRPP